MVVVPTIRALDLRKSYGTGLGENYAIAGVSFQIEAGEFVAITGASGSGKSTLLNLLGCLDRPTGGHYYFEGTDVSSLTPTALANIRNRKLGFVFQAFNLLPRLSAIENVELPLVYARTPKRLRRKRSEAVLASVGLKGKEQRHPNQLSGGEQQRVAIARALINNPRIILADEPTGSLDSQTSLEITRLLRNLCARGIAVVLVTHEESIARMAQKTIMLRDGAIETKPNASRLTDRRED